MDWKCKPHGWVLYQTSVVHVGEWFDEILGKREAGLPVSTLMSDALSCNHVTHLDLVMALCNSHGHGAVEPNNNLGRAMAYFERHNIAVERNQLAVRTAPQNWMPRNCPSQK